MTSCTEYEIEMFSLDELKLLGFLCFCGSSRNTLLSKLMSGEVMVEYENN